eukprot:SAG11_NODE_3875_length_2177_cov_1.218479_1_plen_162_part_00
MLLRLRRCTAPAQEWYKDDVHGVLLQNFPVRGGFSQLYTSHELYSYKLSACEPRHLAAQGLGTVLRLARKIGARLAVSNRTCVNRGVLWSQLSKQRKMMQRTQFIGERTSYTGLIWAGPVIGKNVVIMGSGQNGLIATRLMAQFAAKSVIAVEPLEYRRSE